MSPTQQQLARSVRYRITTSPDGRTHAVTLAGSWVGSSTTPAGAQALIEAHAATGWAANWLTGCVANPLNRELTAPGRRDGCRVFEREDGTWTTYDPARTTVPQWQAATGLPLPLFEPGGLPEVRARAKPTPPPRPPGDPVTPAGLAAAIAALCKENGCQRWELSRRSGVSLHTVRQVCNGNANPSLYTLGCLAKAFGVDVSKLIRLAEETKL